MNEFIASQTKILMTLLEPVGIISSLIFSGIALRNDTRARRIENHIKITEGYRDIWSSLVTNPELDRIRKDGLNLVKFPVTPAEDRIVRFIFQNLLLVLEARNAGQLGDIGNLEKDVTEFVSHPIPRAVWKEIARLQPESLRKFVECLM